MDVSIIIVNYNTKELLKKCINSIFEKTEMIEYEIIVSDNGSKDGSIEMLTNEYPEVILVRNNENIGFGSANNRGLNVARGKYVFYLNSDTILLNNAVKEFFDYWESSKEKDSIGVLGCNLLDSDLNTNLSFGTFPTTKQYYYKILIQLASEYIKPLISKITRKNTFSASFAKYFGEVDFVTGADLFMKNNENAKFDEKFFMYYEETDLQYNLMKKGLSRRLIDGPQIIHLWGGSSESFRHFTYKKVTNIFSDISSLKYFKKNISKPISFMVIKFLHILIWCLPNNIKYTKKYLMEVWKI